MPDLNNVTPELISNYQDSISGQSSVATIKRKLSSLNKFFDWAESNGHMTQNPLKSIQTIASVAKPATGIGLRTIIGLTAVTAFAVPTVLLVTKVQIPIPFINAPAKETGTAQLQPVTSTPSPLPTSSPIASPAPQGAFILDALNPVIKTIGNLLIEGKTITLKTSPASDGDINISPDGAGIAHFIFSGNSGNSLTAENANQNSGSLFYGSVGNDSTGYNLLTLQSGSTPTTKFSVDASGNTTIGGSLNLSNSGLQIGGVTRLNNLGRLSSITGYYQDSGLFSINQGGPDNALISKSGVTAANDALTVTLDETGKTGSIYSSLVLNRLNPASGGYALNVKNGDVNLAGSLTVRGSETFTNFTTNNGLLYTNGSGLLAQTAQGASNTVLHGNGASAPTFSAVSLTTDVTGVLPIANGGTNNSTAYTAGSVIFSDGTKLTQSNSQLFWDNSNSRLGIGTLSPSTTLNVVGTTTLSGSTTLGSTNTNNITFTGRVNSTIDAAGDNLYDLGSSARRWGNIYAVTGNFTNIAGTISGGSTSSSDWLINSGNATADTQNSTLSFSRGTAGTNAQLKWNATGTPSKLFSLNTPLLISRDTNITPSGTASLIVDQNQSQDIFSASASAATKFTIGSTGNIKSVGGANWQPLTDSTSALNIANAAGTGFVSFDTTNSRLGIGITTPSSPLSITASTASNVGQITLINGASWPININQDVSSNFTITNGGATRLTLDASGDLGIGSTPVGKLDLAGAVTGKALSIFNETGDQAIFTASGSGATKFTIAHSGNISVAAGVLWDLSTITHGTTAIQGLKLPQGASLSNPTSGAGYLAYNTSSQQLQVYNGTAWAAAGGSGGTGATGQVTFWTGTSTTSGDANFFWDNTNKLLGVGNGTPVGKLDLAGAVTGKALSIFNETGDQSILTASAGGVTRFSINHEGSITLNGIAASTVTTAGSIYFDSGTNRLNLYTGGAYHRVSTDMTKYTNSNTAVADGGSVTVTHNQNTNDLTATGYQIYGSVAHEISSTSSNGTGQDGSISVSGSTNINTTAVAAGRSFADGIAYRVIAPATAGVTSVTRFSGTDTLTNGLASGDEVLLINLQGASGDFADVGNYEYMIVSSVTASTVTFTQATTKTYAGTTASNQHVVVQRIPNYGTVTMTAAGSIVASAYEGLTTTPTGAAGYLTGVVALRAKDLIMPSGASINATGLGFRGGTGSVNGTYGGKGESYNGANSLASGTDNTANGGGGGGGKCFASSVNGPDSGGGAGYAGAGAAATPDSFSNNATFAGAGGAAYGASSPVVRAYLGSGGGAGGGECAGGGGNSAGSGGRGGGIVLVAADITVPYGAIAADGSAGASAVSTAGRGGGGSGGTVLLVSNSTFNGTLTAAAGASGGTTGTYLSTAGVGSTGRTNRANAEIDQFKIVQTDTNNVKLYNFSGVTQSLRLDVVVFGADLAEWYTTNDSTIESGDVVSFTGQKDETDVPIITKQNIPGDSKLAGIISTKAGQELGIPASNRKLLALAGRVPVKIDPDSEPIMAGDSLTASSKPGFAQKATGPGYVIAKAVESWSKDSGKNKIVALISVGFDDPGIMVAQTNPVILNKQGGINNSDFVSSDSGSLASSDVNNTNSSGVQIPSELKNISYQFIRNIGNFINVIATNIQAGAIETTSLATTGFKATLAEVGDLVVKNKIVSPILQTKVISPIPNSDLTIDLANSLTSSDSAETATASGFGRFIVKGKNQNEVASVDSDGNATFSGKLNSQDLAVQNNATISGDLFASRIHADQIISPSGVSLDQIQATLKQVEVDQKLLTSSGAWTTNTATNSADLTLENIYITKQAAVNSLSLASSLSIGTNMVMQGNSINSTSNPLKIQDLALAPIEAMAGKFVINTNGDVIINGSLNVAGNINSKSINIADNSDTGFSKLLTVSNSQGEVLSVDSSGSAKFKDIQTDKIVIAGSANTSPSSVTGEIQTNATAGTATIPQNLDSITIRNNKITNYTLVYVTPTGDTQNSVLYVKSKGDGFFKVGFSKALNTDVTFNWWLIDVTY